MVAGEGNKETEEPSIKIQRRFHQAKGKSDWPGNGSFILKKLMV